MRYARKVPLPDPRSGSDDLSHIGYGEDYNPKADPLGPFRAIVWSLPLSVIFWMVVVIVLLAWIP
jgi:hypothetical protein